MFKISVIICFDKAAVGFHRTTQRLFVDILHFALLAMYVYIYSGFPKQQLHG